MLNRAKNSARRIDGSKPTANGDFNNVRLSLKKKKANAPRPSHAAAASAIVNNRILAAAILDGSDAVLACMEPVLLRAGDELYAADEQSEFVYFPETAVVSHLYNLSDGNRVETAMVGRDGVSGLCALFSRQPAMHQALVIIGGTARRIRTKILVQEFARGGTLQTLLLDYFTAHLSQISQRVVCTSFHLMEKRLRTWLLMLHDRADENPLPLTHEQIAQFLGVNRPSVSVVAKILRDEGLISYVRGKLYILDRRGLETTACECYSIV